MAKRVHPDMQPDQPSRPDPLSNPVRAKTELGKLVARYDTPLRPRDPDKRG